MSAKPWLPTNRNHRVRFLDEEPKPRFEPVPLHLPAPPPPPPRKDPTDEKPKSKHGVIVIDMSGERAPAPDRWTWWMSEDQFNALGRPDFIEIPSPEKEEKQE